MFIFFYHFYPFLGLIRSIKLVHKNINSINHQIISSEGKFILHNFTDGSPPAKIEKICQILDFCRKWNVKIVQPIKNKQNCFVDRKKKLFLTNFLEGKLFSGTKAEIKDVAKNIAILHKIMARNRIPYNYRTNQQYYKILTLNELQKIKSKIKNKKNKEKIDSEVGKNIDYLIQRFNNIQPFFAILKTIRIKQLIHFDLQPSNVIFNKKEVAAIIDFNSMRMGIIMEDIAFAAFRFASSKTKNIKKITDNMEIFLNTYLQHNHVDKKYLLHIDYFIEYTILKRMSYILRKKYQSNELSWIGDFEKNLNLLKLINKSNNSIKEIFVNH